MGKLILAKKYTGSLSLEWFNKNRSIITQQAEMQREGDVPAPKINWINKDEALFYEISEGEGKGVSPFWVDRNDIRVKESRPLVFQKMYETKPKKSGYKVVKTNFDSSKVENILIKGDNLLALSSLKKIFDQKPDEEKVKCIYIDPPYNVGTGYKQYDDNVQHSEWLTLMRDRLVILRELLASDGSIWISVDDREAHYLKVLLDEIFGREAFIASNVWQKRYSRENREAIGDSHEYIFVYSKSPERFKENRNFLPLGEKQKKIFKNPDNDPRGPWQSVSLTAQGFRPNQMYDIKSPNGNIHTPPPGSCWKLIKSKYKKLITDNRIFFGKDGTGVPRRKYFLNEAKGLVPWTWWPHEEVGHTGEAKKEMQAIFGKDNVFDTPKPERLIQRVLSIATNEGDLILDAFIGSGTTPAVAHKMNRRWIGIEIGDHCDTHCIPRLVDVISGDSPVGISNAEGWNGGGAFKYYHLGESIIAIDDDGFGDFNWELDREFIEASILTSYNYVLDDKLKVSGSLLMKQPTIGFHTINNVTMAGVVSLSSPDEEDVPILNDDIVAIIDSIRAYKSPQSITIFTNRGVEMAYESKPDDVEIIKVPHAIFSELER